MAAVYGTRALPRSTNGNFSANLTISTILKNSGPTSRPKSWMCRRVVWENSSYLYISISLLVFPTSSESFRSFCKTPKTHSAVIEHITRIITRKSRIICQQVKKFIRSILIRNYVIWLSHRYSCSGTWYLYRQTSAYSCKRLQHQLNLKNVFEIDRRNMGECSSSNCS